MLVEKTLSTKRTHSMYRSGQRRRQEPVVREKKMSRRRELSPRAFLCLDLFFNVVFFLKKKGAGECTREEPRRRFSPLFIYFIVFYFILFSFSFYFIGAGERRRQEPGGD